MALAPRISSGNRLLAADVLSRSVRPAPRRRVPAPPATGSPANFQPEPLMPADSPGGAAAGTTVLSSGWAGSDRCPDEQLGRTEHGKRRSSSRQAAGSREPIFSYVRPHFSEATAFATGTQTATSMHITAQDLDFQYSPSFRVFAGYRFEGTDTELRFTYTRLTDQTEADAGNFSPGHFAVDPFGNVAGVAVVVNPTSGNFGHADRRRRSHSGERRGRRQRFRPRPDQAAVVPFAAAGS